MNSHSTKILIMGYIWPELTSSAAGLRDWNLIHTFIQAGWKVIFSSSSPENQYTEQLRRRGIETVFLHPNDPTFDEWIRDAKPDFVIFDRFITEEQFSWRVTENSPDTIQILDTVDLQFLRRGRQQALEDGRTLQEIFECDFDLTSETALRELASIYRSDSTLILSDFEINLLIKRFQIPDDLLFLSRFHYPVTEASPSFSERKNFVMIGNFRHPPNVDGIRWMQSQIWPLIRGKLKTAQLHIYGAYPQKEMMNLTNKETGFYVRGPIEDHFNALRGYRVNLAPLRFGAGIKGKITDGWWVGTPVVTTPIGAEGMHQSLSWGGAIAQGPEDFAEKAIALYSEESYWTTAHRNSLFILKELYSEQLNAKALINHFLDLKAHLVSRRKSNVIRSILQFHLQRSTKYFSKWIEAKNQVKRPVH